jgi:hypothetical protein
MWFDRNWPVLRALFCAILLACLVTFAVCTLHWRLVNDAAQIDYACFLMDHGMAPYKDLVELNMPGIYLVNWSVMHTLGPGALAWRIFDFSLLGIAALAMVWIARPYGWFGGAFAGALFALFHGRDGAAQEGQRDLIIAILLLCAYALLFHAVRHRLRWPMFFFGVCAVGAAAIKPIALPFVLVILAAGALRLRQLKRPFGVEIALAAAGMLAASSIVIGFLAAHGSLSAFAWMVEKTLPYYATLGRQDFPALFTRFMSPTVRTLLVLGLAVAIGRRAWSWESLMVLAGVAFGIFSYFAQGKGFPYHRYPMLAFIFLWAGIQFIDGLRAKGIAHHAAIAGLCLGVIFAPVYVAWAVRSNWDEAYNEALSADLDQLGGGRLSGHVQCLTTAGDCDTVLYRKHLVQSTGLIYDYFVFGPASQPSVAHARQQVWQAFNASPPRVIVVGRSLYGELPDNYQKLDHWPELNGFLRANYTLYDERGFRPAECGFRGYRIYVRKPAAQPAPTHAPFLQASLNAR